MPFGGQVAHKNPQGIIPVIKLDLHGYKKGQVPGFYITVIMKKYQIPG
jgi:hypothetical protein